MTDPNPHIERLRQLLALVAREEFHLRGVRERLFGDLPDAQLTEAWLRQTLATPEGIDRIESFGAKFGRMQDTLVDKLLPALLRASAEQPGTALDNLHRAERLGLLQDADAWPAMRLIRNRLVHEYFSSAPRPCCRRCAGRATSSTRCAPRTPPSAATPKPTSLAECILRGRGDRAANQPPGFRCAPSGLQDPRDTPM